jgi:hypothetical protein
VPKKLLGSQKSKKTEPIKEREGPIEENLDESGMGRGRRTRMPKKRLGEDGVPLVEIKTPEHNTSALKRKGAKERTAGVAEPPDLVQSQDADKDLSETTVASEEPPVVVNTKTPMQNRSALKRKEKEDIAGTQCC